MGVSGFNLSRFTYRRLIRYFSHRSVRRLKRDVGCQPIRELQKYLTAYAVEGVGNTGSVVTRRLAQHARQVIVAVC